MARTKPKPMIIGDLKQAEATLQEIAELDRQIADREARMNEVIDQAKANAKAECAPLASRRKGLADSLATFAILNKAELFAKRKSLDLGFGIFGFRRATKLVTLPKVNLAQVLERLRELGFKDGIRTNESVDKEAMRDWPDERLGTVGMSRVSGDEFFLEIKQESVGNTD